MALRNSKYDIRQSMEDRPDTAGTSQRLVVAHQAAASLSRTRDARYIAYILRDLRLCRRLGEPVPVAPYR